ncbi:hypothetical protein BH11ACT8_BH11ACT8_27140 [soil metagenome]
MLGRRGPEHAAFTVPELVGLVGLVDRGALDVVVDTGGVPIEGSSRKVELLRDLAGRPRRDGVRTIVLRFGTRPTAILGQDRVSGVEVERTTAEGNVHDVIAAGLVLRAIGYRGLPVTDLPYDATTGTVPHDRGRVRPGLYVAGWVKRGPSGFIGSNKSCAQQTVTALLDDLDAGLPTPLGTSGSIAAVVAGRCPDVLDLAGWRVLDAEERRRGAARGRPRAKIVAVDEMVRVAAAAAVPPTRRRYPVLRSTLQTLGGLPRRR